jgi:exopolysaccharide production protein ExoQ
MACQPTWLAVLLLLGSIVAVGFAGSLVLLAIIVTSAGISLSSLADIVPALEGLDSLRVLIVVGGCVILTLRRRSLLLEWRRVVLYVGFLGFAAASLAWSPSPTDGLRLFGKLTYPCLAFLLTSLAVRQYGERPLISMLLITAGVATSINLGAAVMGLTPFTGPGYEGRYAGTLHPNSLGLFCATGALIMYGLWSHYRRAVFAVMTCLLLVQWVATGSRTAMIAGGAAFMLLEILRGRVLRVIGYTAIGICIWMTVPTLGQRTTALMDSDVGTSQLLAGVNLSGRSTLWVDVWAALMGDQQMLGRGVGATEAFFKSRYEGLVSVHNGYVQIMIDLGLVGLALLVCSFVTMAYDSMRQRNAKQSRPPYAELTLALLLALLLTSFTESTFAGYGFHVVIVWIMYGLAISRRQSGREVLLGSRPV